MIKIRFFMHILFALGISVMLSGPVPAQKAAAIPGETAKPCSGEKFVMPASIANNDEAFLRYFSIISVSGKERNNAFGVLSNEQKASVVRFQYAVQLAKRPNLTKDQADFLLDILSRVSPDIFDKTDAEKIRTSNTTAQDIETRGLSLFSRKDAFDILSGLQADKQADFVLFQRYSTLLESGMVQRRKIVREMPMAERVGIWKTQLAFHLAASRLTAEQQKFIVDTIPNIQSILEASANLSKEDREVPGQLGV